MIKILLFPILISIYITRHSVVEIIFQNENLIKESDCIYPQNSYGLTKYISELLLQDFCKSHIFLTLCIGRIFSFYHETQKPPFLYPTLKKRFETEDLSVPFILHGANSTRDFLPAEEVCSIIIKIIET